MSELNNVNAAAAEQHTEPKPKVEFSEAQQERINEIIRESMGRAGAEARAEAARLKAELDAVKASATVTPDAAAELALSRAELAAIKSQQRQAELDRQLREAAGDTFLDSSLGVLLMKQHTRIGVDGKPVVVNADGTPAMDSQFNPLSLEGLAQKIASEKAFLARGQVRSGAGSYPSQSAPTTGPKLEDLFGKHSNGAAANRLALARPSEYKRLRQLARERNLI